MKKIFTILLIFVPILFASKVTKPPSIGQKAPEIKLEKILGNTGIKDITLAKLKGKLVILEFWATWCSPCIAALNHLSELQKRYKDKLLVIAITNENESKIKKFIENKPLDLIIGIDSDTSTFNIYDPQTIPHSVLIGKDGIIKAITLPGEITIEKINKLLSGQKVYFKQKNRLKPAIEDSEEEAIDNQTIFSVKIRLSNNEATFLKKYEKGEFKDRRVTASGFTIPMLYQNAYGLISCKRLIKEFKNPEKYKFENAEKYYIDLIVPEYKRDNFYKIMISCLNDAFSINAKIEKRKVKVKVLKVKEQGKIEPSQDSETAFTFRGPKLNAVNIPILKFVEYLENFSKYPIIDETGLTEKYNIYMEWQFEDKLSFYNEIERLGFNLEVAEREIEFLVLSD